MTVLFNMDVEVHAKNIADGNGSIVYKRKGDFSSYGINLDQTVYEPITSIVVSI